jgi:hypothetical protein
LDTIALIFDLFFAMEMLLNQYTQGNDMQLFLDYSSNKLHYHMKGVKSLLHKKKLRKLLKLSCSFSWPTHCFEAELKPKWAVKSSTLKRGLKAKASKESEDRASRLRRNN